MSAQRFSIAPCTGVAIELAAGQRLTIIDDEGGQVVDFFAEARADPDKVLSSGVTIDCNESLGL